MDHVLAKIKRLRKNPYKKLLSDVTLFENIDLGSISPVEYNSDHNLDEDSWFRVDNFSDKDFFIEVLSKEIDSKDYDDLTRNKFSDISCLLAVQGEDVYFQKVTPASFIRRKMISFGESATIEADYDKIVVKEKPDAIFLRGENALLFRDIASVSSIFEGIDQLYRESTDAEVVEFLKSEFIETKNSYDYSSVSKPNRKRLALVTQTMKNMPQAQRENLVDYIKEYCKDGVSIAKDGKKFEISTDNQLKLVLYGIEERFYTTQHSQQKRLANSVQTIG